jgi:amino acid transporter
MGYNWLMRKSRKVDRPKQNDGGALNLDRVSEYLPQRSWRTWLIGRPLPTADAPHQTIGKAVGLAVFGADALSSIAYAPQETLVILAAAGSQAFGYAFPISLVITLLLGIVTISYIQTIHAYPSGGGAYTVVKENLGVPAALVTGAALLTDYILLAAVTVSSGVAQIVSAFPVLFPFRVLISVSLLGLVAIANLRGVKESGNVFALPTYFFLGMTTLTVVVGFIRYLSGTLGSVINPPPLEAVHV